MFREFFKNLVSVHYNELNRMNRELMNRSKKN